MCSVLPVDTPTNWASLATGATAATHGITGFESWQKGTSLKHLLGPEEAYRKFRAAEFLWEAADRQGKTSLLINYPFGWYSKEGLERTVIVGGDAIKGGFSEIHGIAYYCTPDRCEKIANAQKIVLRPSGNGYRGELSFGEALKTKWTAIGDIPADQLEDASAGLWARLHTVPGSPPRLLIEDPAGKELVSITPGQWTEFLRMRFGNEDGWLRFLLVDLSHGPGIRRGVRIGGATTIQIAPTLAHLGEIQPPAQCEGTLLSGIL